MYLFLDYSFSKVKTFFPLFFPLLTRHKPLKQEEQYFLVDVTKTSNEEQALGLGYFELLWRIPQTARSPFPVLGFSILITYFLMLRACV